MIEVHNEHVIRGNSVTLRCNIPAFVADFLTVTAWQDTEGNSYTLEGKFAGWNKIWLQKRRRLFNKNDLISGVRGAKHSSIFMLRHDTPDFKNIKLEHDVSINVILVF